jgi:hypothetical protein
MNTDWYFLPLLLVIILLVATNEWGIAVLTLGPLLILPAYWLMTKVLASTL